MINSKYTELAAKLFCVGAVIFFVWLIFEYAVGIVIPFAISFCVGVPIYFLSEKIYKKLHLPRKLCAFVLVLLLLAALGFFLFWAVNRLFLELEKLVSWAQENGNGIKNTVDSIIGYAEGLSAKIPFVDQIESIRGLENFRENIDSAISRVIDNLISALSSAIPAIAMGVIRYTPKAVITVIVTLLACFYFALDYGKLRDGLMSWLSPAGRERAQRVGAVTGNAVKRYIRAYLLIMLLTFTEVFVGLIVLGKQYAFLMAVIVAVVDILPVFGAGAVLIPWAVGALILKDFRTGFGLLILFGIMTIIRQIAEPKIVGESLGIHPLITLFAMFAGLSLFGIPGMLLGPAVVLIVKEVIGKNDTVKM